MDGQVITAIAVGVGGIVLGAVVAPIVRRMLSGSDRPEPIREVAPVAASFVFWMLVALGLVFALGMTSPDTLRPIPSRLVAYFPRVIVAGVLLLLGNVAGTLVGFAATRAALRATGSARPAAGRIVKAVIVAASGILAVSQLGVNTTIINIAVAALVFSIGGASALLVGLGGRDVARHLAAGRYLRRVIRPGDTLEVDDVVGTVRAVHAASIELEVAGGGFVHLPHARVIDGAFELRRPPTADAGPPAPPATSPPSAAA